MKVVATATAENGQIGITEYNDGSKMYWSARGRDEPTFVPEVDEAGYELRDEANLNDDTTATGMTPEQQKEWKLAVYGQDYEQRGY